MDDQVAAGFFHGEVGGGSALEDEGINRGRGWVGDDILTVAFGEDVGIITGITIEGIVTGPAIKGIIPIIAAQCVIAPVAIESVVVIPAVERVIALGTVDGEAHGGEIVHGEDLVVKDDAETLVAGGDEIVSQRHGIVSAVGVDDQVVAGLLHGKVGGWGTVKDEGIDRVCGCVLNDVLTVASDE